MYVLGLVVMQDALFAGGKWQEAASQQLLTRLDSVPQDAVDLWAVRRDLDKFTAALSLVRRDNLFVSDKFQVNRLASLK
jgi:hypothetical protein